MNVDVIIPTYKPGKELFTLIDRLREQTVKPAHIILMNTEERYYEALVNGKKNMDKYRDLHVYHLSSREFDHGKTRHMGIKKSDADIFIMMTQDAMPADEHLIENLIRPLQGKVAVSYGRQLATETSDVLEIISREFNYPPKSCIKSIEDLGRLGIKTFFCSNVCAAYRRDIYNETDGFIRHTIFNEDMIYAAKVLKRGYQIAYEASAMVYHSHSYSNKMQFRRNFDLGVSQADHPEVFANIHSEAEGKKLVEAANAYLKAHNQRGKLPHFYMQCACKYAGYLMGKNYRKLPRWLVLKNTMNKEYWRQEA